MIWAIVSTPFCPAVVLLSPKPGCRPVGSVVSSGLDNRVNRDTP